MSAKRIAGGLTVLLFALGCGSSKDSNATTSGTNGGGGSGNAGGGGAGGSGGITESMYPIGSISLESDSPDGFAETYVAAGFQSKATAGCTTTVEGDCAITDCRSAKTMAKLSSAGKLTISGGDMPIVINQGASGSYDLETSDQSWSSNRKLTVKASGGDVPAFTLSGEAPPLVTVSAPNFDNGQITVDRSKGLDVAWKNGVGKVELLLVRDPDKRVTMTCIWDAAANKATIPAATLAKVPTDASFTWGLIVRDTNEAQAKAGDWTVNLAISQIGKTAVGNGSDAVEVVVQ